MSAVAIGFSNFCAALISRIANCPLAGDQHLLAVGRHLERRPASSSTVFSSRSAKSKKTIGLFVSAGAGARLPPVQQLALDRLEVGVVAGLRRQDDGARLEAVEIDVDVLGVGRFRRGFVGLLLVFSASSVFASAFFCFSGFVRLGADSRRRCARASGDWTSLRSGTATSCVGFG